MIEYLTAEILEFAEQAAVDLKKARFGRRHIQLAIRNDEKLKKLFDTVNIASSHAIQKNHHALLPRKRGPSKSDVSLEV